MLKVTPPPIPHHAVQEFIKEHDLPLNLFYSKSKKGAHAYLFTKIAIPAEDMVANLKMYATLIEPLLHEDHDIEIFPKQTTLEEDQDGNCIRIPWFGKECRPIFEGMPRVEVLTTVPPCLRELPEKGGRNNFIYHISVFLRYHGLKNVKNLTLKYNEAFTHPLPEEEVHKSDDSGRRHYNRNIKKGFGLGCSSCPTPRKATCKFASQQAVAEISSLVNITILHYISSEEKIKISIDGKEIIFAPDDAFNHHRVSTAFILKHEITSIPEMKQGEWVRLLKDLLKEAKHVQEIDPSDMGHYIIDQLSKWSTKFHTGIDNLYNGYPVFINEKEIMLMPYDLYQYLSTKGVYGVTREDVNKTLASIGTLVRMGGKPAIKIPVSALKLEGIPIVPPTTVNNIDPEELNFVPGDVVRITNQLGIEIRLTDEYLQAHPDVQQKIIENTTTTKTNVGF